MVYPWKNFIFEGGGVKGIAYVGANQVFEVKSILGNIERVGGTSAGAINALLFALDFNANSQTEILSKVNFSDFMDRGNLFSDMWHFFKNFGWYRGNTLEKWMGGLIESKTGSAQTTFKELSKRSDKFRELYVIATNLSTKCSEVFSHELTPDVPILDAVRASMSIPVFFGTKTINGDCYVDGGVLRNFPIKLFDQKKYLSNPNNFLDREYYQNRDYIYNKETLGFRLEPRSLIPIYKHEANFPHEKVDSLYKYGKALATTLLDHESHHHIHSDDWHRTVYIDSIGVKTTDFSLDEMTIRRLINSGSHGASKYLDWWEDTTKDVAINQVESNFEKSGE